MLWWRLNYASASTLSDCLTEGLWRCTNKKCVSSPSHMYPDFIPAKNNSSNGRRDSKTNEVTKTAQEDFVLIIWSYEGRWLACESAVPTNNLLCPRNGSRELWLESTSRPPWHPWGLCPQARSNESSTICCTTAQTFSFHFILRRIQETIARWCS